MNTSGELHGYQSIAQVSTKNNLMNGKLGQFSPDVGLMSCEICTRSCICFIPVVKPTLNYFHASLAIFRDLKQFLPDELKVVIG